MSTVKIKRSTTSGNVPPSLVSGEIAINETDRKLFFRNAAGEVDVLLDKVGSVVDNLVINGGMEVSQELVTNYRDLISGSQSYVVDCWRAGFSASGLAFRGQQIAPPGTPSFGSALPSCLRMLAVTGGSLGGTATDYALIQTPIEDKRWKRLCLGEDSAKSLRVGFWVYATIAGVMCVSLQNDNFNVGVTRSIPVNVTINNPNTWEWKTVVITGDHSIAWSNNCMSLGFCFGAGANYRGTAAVWQAGNKIATSSITNFFASNTNVACITGVVLTAGLLPTVADSPMAIRTFDEELAMCLRYYEKSYNYAVTPGTSTDVGAVTYYFARWPNGITPDLETMTWPLRYFRKRTTPTIHTYSKEGTIDNISHNGPGGIPEWPSFTESVGDCGCGVGANLNSTTPNPIFAFQYVVDARL